MMSVNISLAAANQSSLLEIPIYSAIQSGDTTLLRELILDKNVNINQVSQDITPLIYALSKKNTDAVRLLISNGVELTVERKGIYPLYAAMIYYEGEAINLMRLIAKNGGATAKVINHQLSDGSTILHSAVLWNQLEITKLLLDAGADVNIKNNQGESALFLAYSGLNREIVSPLFKYGAELHNENFLAYRAIIGKENALLTLLLEHGLDENLMIDLSMSGKASLENLVSIAIRAGFFGGIKSLVTYGADVNTKERDTGSTPLVLAAQKGRADFARYLLDVGADASLKDNDGYDALHYAKKNHYSEIVELLNAGGIEGNMVTMSPPAQLKKLVAPAVIKPEVKEIYSELTVPEKQNGVWFWGLGVLAVSILILFVRIRRERLGGQRQGD